MSDEKKLHLQLLELPIEDDMIENRIWALHDLMVESDKDYVEEVLAMLLNYIGDSFEGYAIEQAIYRINEGKLWWSEGMDYE
tara:strand:+ start:302 stop:547 length:246 start_codon:yes stop_codon:yes gene_type:complete